MLCGYENVFPSQNFVPYYLSCFVNDKQYKYMHHKHKKYKKYFKNKAT